MKQKQCSIDFFFSPKKSIQKELQSDAAPIKNKIDNDNKKPLSDTLPLDIASHGSSSPPTSPLETFEFNITEKQNENKVQVEKIPQLPKNDSNEEKIQTPEWQNESKKIKRKQNQPNDGNHPKMISMNDEEERDLHWKLEIIEHRIQFGKDLDHPHPAMAPDILEKDGLQNIRSREKTRLKHYEQIKCMEYIPDFWEPRCWDNEYPKLNHAQSEFLLQSMIEAPLKKRVIENSDSDNQAYYSYSSSPSTSATNSSSDDEDEKCEIKNSIIKPKTRVGFNQTVKRIIKKPMSLRLSSLLFDTDSDADTDLENF